MTRRLADSLAGLALAALAASSCTVGPDYQAPIVDAPADWRAPADGEVDAGTIGDAASIDRWWSELDDPALDSAVGRAIERNRDLAAARFRVAAAHAARGVARGEWFPDVDGGASYERSRASANGPLAPPSVTLPPESAGEAPRTITPEPANRNLTSIGVDASFEVDVFGRVRRSVEAADADLGSAIEDAADVQVIVVAEVVRTYVEAATFRERLAIAEDNVRSQEQTLELTRTRNRAELSAALDVAQAESNLELTRSEIPALTAGLDAALFRLALLLGEAPGAGHEVATITAVRSPPAVISIGVPSDVLARRPDVRSAERRLAARVARVGVATADLYPRFSITGGYGYESLDGSQTLDSDSRTYYVGPSMRWNLFDGGRVRGVIRLQDALAEEARVVFDGVVLRALQEVEIAVSAYRNERERARRLEAAARAADAAVGYVRDVYREGLTDFQNVLDAERTLFRAQDLAAISRGRVLEAWVAIWRALGGGGLDGRDSRDGR
jgi:multidrug efflux system outer membrane protein